MQAIRYALDSAFLEVLFLDGGMYRYENVPLSVYQAMRVTFSPGKFVHNMLHGRYPYTRVQ